MHAPLIYEELAARRCAERQHQSLRNWEIEQALAETRPPARPARGPAALLRRAAWRAAWRLTRLAGAESGPYTVKGRVTLVDARGMTRTVCPDECSVVLLLRTDRDAA